MQNRKLSLEEVQEKAKKIKLLVLDVGGVLSSAYVTFSSSGEELKKFNSKDGMGILLLQKAGIQVAIITGGVCPIVKARADYLKIQHVYQGKKNKLPTFEELLEKLKLGKEEVAFMGDDLIDLEVLRIAGLSACPKDSARPVIEACHFVSEKDGGCGAVREVCDLILEAKAKQVTRLD